MTPWREPVRDPSAWTAADLEREIRLMGQSSSIRPTLSAYRTYKNTINRLVGRLDVVVVVVAAELADELAIRVLVILTPELSGVVSEPTTLSVPLSKVKRVAAPA